MPVDEVESPFPLSDRPVPDKTTILGKIYLVGILVPLLVAVLFLGVIVLQGGKLFYTAVYPPRLFQQIVEGKPMDRVLEILGPPGQLGEEGDITRWIYEPGMFDFSLYPFLPWQTPIMNGIIVRDPGNDRSPRRIVLQFVRNNANPGITGKNSGLRDNDGDLRATVEFEY